MNAARQSQDLNVARKALLEDILGERNGRFLRSKDSKSQATIERNADGYHIDFEVREKPYEGPPPVVEIWKFSRNGGFLEGFKTSDGGRNARKPLWARDFITTAERLSGLKSEDTSPPSAMTQINWIGGGMPKSFWQLGFIVNLTRRPAPPDAADSIKRLCSEFGVGCLTQEDGTLRVWCYPGRGGIPEEIPQVIARHYGGVLDEIPAWIEWKVNK